MRLSNWEFIVHVIIALSISTPVINAAEETNGTKLTYRDSGLYCNLEFIHGRDPQKDGVDNLLTPERASSTESPWSFYLIQLKHLPTQAEIKLINRMSAARKKVILRVDVGRLSPAPNVDQMESCLVDTLKGIDPDQLYAIILGEEQVYWNGWTDALSELYRRAKLRWPDLPVYQWWTPMEVPNVRVKAGWIALPADGWVVDLYGRGRAEFERKLVMTLETGKPVIHVIWSSPDWPDLCGASSWDEGGRRVFDEQLDICRIYNIPVAHFCTQKPIRRDDAEIEPIRWGWHAVNPVVREWYGNIEMLAKNNRMLPNESIGTRVLDKQLFDWAHDSDRAAPASE